MTYSPPAYSMAALRKSVITLPTDSVHCPAGGLVLSVDLFFQSTTMTNANTAVIYPFYVWEDCTVYKLGFGNGSAGTGNFDIALYNASLARLVAAGSTASAGASIVQWVDVADTALTANTLYYAAINHDSGAANHVWAITAANVPLGGGLLMGVQEDAIGAVTLPDPLVPATLTVARSLPAIFLATVSGVS